MEPSFVPTLPLRFQHHHHRQHHHDAHVRMTISAPPPPARRHDVRPPSREPSERVSSERGTNSAPPHVHSMDELQQLLRAGDRRVLILKVYSRRCRSCMRIARPFERMAIELESQVRFVQLCAEQGTDMMRDLGVRSFPTFVLYRDGKRLDHFATSCSDTLREHIEDSL